MENSDYVQSIKTSSSRSYVVLLSVALRLCTVRLVPYQRANGELVAVNGTASIDIQRSIPHWTCTSGLAVCLFAARL